MREKGSLLKMFNIFSTLEISLLPGVLKHAKFPPGVFACIYYCVAT